MESGLARQSSELEGSRRRTLVGPGGAPLPGESAGLRGVVSLGQGECGGYASKNIISDKQNENYTSKPHVLPGCAVF